MIKLILQTMKYRKFKNILMVIQFTIGFTALLFGLGCFHNVMQYKKNVEGLAALDTIHASILGGDGNMESPVTMLPQYRNTFRQVQDSGLAEKMGFFELMYVYDNPQDSQTETRLYALNEDCIAMSDLPMQEGSMEPLENYGGNTGRIPVVVSSSMKDKYKMGRIYELFYMDSKTSEYEKISVEVAGILAPSANFWRGGSTYLSENIGNNKEFLLVPQFMDFKDEITYSMNSLLQLSGTEAEKEEKLEQIQAIFLNNQLELQYITLQEEVDSYYETQKVVFVGTLTFAGILLILSLLGCIGAILAGITIRYREFGIYYAMGFTKRNIVYLVQGEIIVLFGVSFLLATAVSKLLFEVVIAESPLTIDLSVIVTAFAIMLVCILLCSVMPFRKLKKMEPIGMLKGENR